MLQIIHVANVGGAEKHTRLISKEFARRGFTVTLIYPPGPYAAEYAALSRLGVACIEQDIRAHPLRAIAFVRRVIREKKIDIIHSHMLGADFIAACARIGLGTRHISTIHALPMDQIGRFFVVRGMIMAFAAYHCMEKVFAVSSPVADRIRRALLLPRQKVEVTLNSIDFGEMAVDAVRAAHVRHRLKSSPDSIIVMCVSAFYPGKGQPYLIEAMPILARDYPGIKLVLLGSGGEEAELKRLVTNLGLDERVVFAGCQLNVADWLSTADVYVQPSVYLDPLPRALLEAMYMGLPIVASALPTICQVITHAETGLCVQPRSAEGIAAAIRFFLDNPDKGRRMGAEAKRFVEKHCSMDAMAERICDALNISPPACGGHTVVRNR